MLKCPCRSFTVGNGSAAGRYAQRSLFAGQTSKPGIAGDKQLPSGCTAIAHAWLLVPRAVAVSLPLVPNPGNGEPAWENEVRQRKVSKLANVILIAYDFGLRIPDPEEDANIGPGMHKLKQVGAFPCPGLKNTHLEVSFQTRSGCYLAVVFCLYQAVKGREPTDSAGEAGRGG